MLARSYDVRPVFSIILVGSTAFNERFDENVRSNAKISVNFKTIFNFRWPHESGFDAEKARAHR